MSKIWHRFFESCGFSSHTKIECNAACCATLPFKTVVRNSFPLDYRKDREDESGQSYTDMLYRLLQAQNTTLSDNGNLTDFRADDHVPDDDEYRANNTLSSSSDDGSESLAQQVANDVQRFGFVVVALVFATAMVAGYRFYVCCRRRRQRREMELVNTRADIALGDMVMVSTALSDDDEDGELL